MNSAQKLMTFAGIALGAGALALFVLNRPPQDQDVPKAPPHQAETERKVEQAKPLTPTSQSAPQRVEEPTRTEVNIDRTGAQFAQGIKGKVIDPGGAAVGGAKVYLMPGMTTNIFEMMQAMQAGVVHPPVARGETDAAGVFALGIERVDATKTYELKVITDKYVDNVVRNLRIQERDWYDAGTLTLEAGIAVSGTVMIAGSPSVPVPNAIVTLKQIQAGFGSDIAAVPGREKGIVAKADQTGRYRFDNAPAGIVNMSAVAPNFARFERQNQNLEKNNTNNVVNFELSEGKVIDGSVVDPQGAPVPGAKVTAIAISSKTPINEDTRTGPDGRFELIGLIDASYQLNVVAQGFVANEIKPVEAGTRGLQITLEKQGIVTVQVYSKSGRLMSAYTLTVKSVFENSDQYGNTTIPAKLVRSPKDGIGTIEGVNPGKYVLQVEADGHARAFSEAFQVVAGTDPPLLTVRMNEGGVIEGVVQDENGKPLGGVTISTIPNNFDENPFTAMFNNMIPCNITRVSATTNAEGTFRFALLNEGKYQLKFQDPGRFDVFMKDIDVQTGATTKMPPVRMDRGVQVEGTVLVDGAPAGQVKVTISTAQDPLKPGGVAAFNADAVTDSQGHFRMPKRLPPGRYQVMASRQTLANPLMQIVDFQKTKQEVDIPQGQDTYVLNITMTSN